MNIDCGENIGYWHFILSYVRGIHYNSSLSHSFMLAKGIHDLDLMLWLTGLKPARVSSFGSLKFFTEENAPPGAPERCAQGCPVEAQCEFSALKQYVKPGRPDIPFSFFLGQSLDAVIDLVRYPRYRSMGSIVSQDDQSEAAILKALEETSFGRCVFRSPNNVVDHQTVNLEFENGVTASYSLSGFSLIWERSLNFHGSKGELRTADFSGKLETRTFNPARVREREVPLPRHFARRRRPGDPAGVRKGRADRQARAAASACGIQPGKPSPGLCRGKGASGEHGGGDGCIQGKEIEAEADKIGK